MIEWISVNDRLPEPATDDDWYGYGDFYGNLKMVITREVFSRDKTARYSVEVSMYVRDEDKYWADDETGCAWLNNLSGDVIYWADLPKLPKELDGSKFT